MISGLKLNLKTVRQIRRSPEVARELAQRAEKIRAAAGADDHEVTVQIGKTRARASVRTSTPRGMALEARDRNLSRALDAGR